MKVSLKILSQGKTREHHLQVNGVVTFGRSRGCEIQIEDLKVSGRHCRFYLKKDRLELTDLDSKNGTYLNGIRIDQTEVFVGDQVRIGDVLITLEEKEMPEEVMNALSFPGAENDRMDYALKADFTGARIQNQLGNNKSPSQKNQQVISHAKEIDLRKKMNSKIRVSKQEIRSRNKLQSLMASLLDMICLLMVLSLPLMIVATLPPSLSKGTRIGVLGILVVGFGVSFIIYNFKKSKFTLGEKMSGIAKLHDNQ